MTVGNKKLAKGFKASTHLPELASNYQTPAA